MKKRLFLSLKYAEEGGAVSQGIADARTEVAEAMRYYMQLVTKSSETRHVMPCC